MSKTHLVTADHPPNHRGIVGAVLFLLRDLVAA